VTAKLRRKTERRSAEQTDRRIRTRGGRRGSDHVEEERELRAKQIAEYAKQNKRKA
jgi:hypothetical protein